MDERPKKPRWMWIVATLVALPVLYVASFIATDWLNRYELLPEWAYPRGGCDVTR